MRNRFKVGDVLPDGRKVIDVCIYTSWSVRDQKTTIAKFVDLDDGKRECVSTELLEKLFPYKDESFYIYNEGTPIKEVYPPERNAEQYESPRLLNSFEGGVSNPDYDFDDYD